jgi:phosphoribosylformimino-5-aminoimidazole carboxamide ribotide isomerase
MGYAMAAPMLLIPKLFVRNSKVTSPSDRHSIPDDPLIAAAQWAGAGIEIIHIVDLDVPAAGPIPNANLVMGCIKTHHLRVHVSGNFKTIDMLQKYATLGIETIVLGSIAYQNPEFLKEAVSKAPGKIGVSIDVKNGKVVIPGWAVSSHKNAVDYYDQFAKVGVSCCYFSDTVESGAEAQIHLDGVRTFAEHASVPLYYNGEIMTVDDMAALLLVEKFGVRGCVISKALYEQRLDLASSVTYLRERSHDALAEPTIMED